MAIRKATQSDIPVIQKIAEITWQATYTSILSKEQLKYMLHLIYATEALEKQMRDGHHFYVLTEQTETIGFIDVEKINDTKTKLHKIYLLPDQQGKNYGKLLINYAIEKAKENNSTALQLNVNRHNKAKNFYDKLGFRVKYEDDIDIGNGYFMNDYIMELAINNE
jgi:ribosomal protein S18 acetylase RimI-like enzyme